MHCEGGVRDENVGRDSQVDRSAWCWTRMSHLHADICDVQPQEVLRYGLCCNNNPANNWLQTCLVGIASGGSAQGGFLVDKHSPQFHKLTAGGQHHPKPNGPTSRYNIFALGFHTKQYRKQRPRARRQRRCGELVWGRTCFRTTCCLTQPAIELL